MLQYYSTSGVRAPEYLSIVAWRATAKIRGSLTSQHSRPVPCAAQQMPMAREGLEGRSIGLCNWKSTSGKHAYTDCQRGDGEGPDNLRYRSHALTMAQKGKRNLVS